MATSRTIAVSRPHAEAPRARPRAELSRERILGAALELIDANGLKALNMRDLGLALGASTMGVYRHFRNKSELLDAVVDHVTEGFAPTPIEGSWQTQAKALSLNVRAAMLAHPELADLIGREFRRSPTSLRVNTEIIERLRVSGVPMALLPDAYWAISSYTNGYALLEAQAYSRRRRSEPKTSGPERVRKAAALLQSVEGVSPDALQDAALVLSRPLDDAQFLFGLECLIRGLEDKFASVGDGDQTEA
jgi:AcrR family transcriptional regulator